MVECTQSEIIVKLKFYVLHVLFTIFQCVLLKRKMTYRLCCTVEGHGQTQAEEVI